MNAYEPPKHFGDARPVVLIWYRAYCGLMALGYVLSLGLVVYSLGFSDGLVLENGVLLFLSTSLTAFYIFAALVPLKPWGWSVAFGAIVLGFVSFCFMPMALPILLKWLKPTTKAAFGRPPI